MTPDCFGLTDPGRKRDLNEDQFLVAALAVPAGIIRSSIPVGDLTPITGGHLFVVADGLGGHNGGERASSLAVRTTADRLVEALARPAGLADPDYVVESALREAVETAADAVDAAAAADPNLGGMGTTLTLALVRGERLHLAHAGDSRLYLFRAGRLWPLTRDHTYAELLAEQGRPVPPEAARVLVNCLGGGSPGVAPELATFPVWPGDAILLCTDGLHGPVPADAIARVLAASATAEAAARALVAAANAAGGPDNVTAVVARFRSGG